MKNQIAQITNPAINTPGIASGNDGGNALGVIMGNLYNVLVMVGALALLLYLAWGGINWITAGGDKGKVEAARDKITNAIVGMAILVAVIAVANLLSSVFGINLLNPEVPTP